MTTRRHSAFSIGLLAAVVVLTSCSGVQKVSTAFKDIVTVQAALVRALGLNQIRVLLAGQFLNVGIVNSPLHDLSVDEKKAKALEIARLAYNTFPSRSELKDIIVTFAVHRSYLGIFNFDDSRDSFNFDVTDLTREPR